MTKDLKPMARSGRRALLAGLAALALAPLAASAQTEAPPLRGGAPKHWEDAGLWSDGGDWSASLSGNVQHRVALLALVSPVGLHVPVVLVYNSAESNRQRGYGYGFR